MIMTVIVQIGEFIANSFVKLWTAFGTWGVLGVCIIFPVILSRIVNLIKKIFQF